jgi:hypothetical protein
MSGIQLMLLGGAGRGATGPSITDLVYAPYSNNIDTIIEIGRKSFGADYGTISSFLLESDSKLIKPYARKGNTVRSFTSVSNVASTAASTSRTLTSYSNYAGFWTSQSPDPQYQFFSVYVSSADKTYIGRTTLTGNFNRLGEIWTGTESPANIAVPTSEYAFVFRTNGQIRRLTMATPWELDFVSTQNWDSPYTSGTRSISFSPTGDKLYVAVNATVYEHIMTVPYDLTTISGAAFRSATITSSSFQLQGGYYGLSNAGTFAFYQYVLGSKKITAPSYPSGGASSFLFGSYVAPNGTDVFLTYNSLVGSVNNRFVQKITLGSSYNPSSATAAQQALVSTDGTPLVATFFKSDGTKAFFLRAADILAFDLGTPWDLSTMSATTGYTFSLSFDPQGIWFSANGTKMFVSDNNFDAVFEYDLGTAWDVSTASQSTQIFFSGTSGSVGGVSFNSSGTVMYVCTGEGRKVIQFNLTVPFSLATATVTTTREMGMVGYNIRQMSINSAQDKVLFVSSTLNAEAVFSAFDV